MQVKRMASSMRVGSLTLRTETAQQQRPASPQSSGSGSHPGLLVRAPGSQPALNADSCDESEQTSNLQSSPIANTPAAELEHHHAEAGDSRPQLSLKDADSKHDEPAASSSGWSLRARKIQTGRERSGRWRRACWLRWEPPGLAPL